MSVFWTRARHAELGDVVLPAAAVESYPGWEPVGQPSDDPDALHAEIDREQTATRLAALEPPQMTDTSGLSVLRRQPATPGDAAVPDSESSAPAGADPKE